MSNQPGQKRGPFEFYEYVSLLQPTGLQAGDLEQLLAFIKIVEPGVIYHHMHQHYLKATTLVPEYSNDFSAWAAQSLEERVLAEKLTSLDLYGLNDLSRIRQSLVKILEDYLMEYPRPRPVYSGYEFNFNDTVDIVVATECRAETQEEFCSVLQDVSTSSIYFHFFVNRLRLGRPFDDFSIWLENTAGEQEIARQIRQLDPYFHSLEGLRSRIVEIICHGNGS